MFKIRCSQIGKIMGNAKVKGELSATCKTYLEEWYAGDNEQIRSKYMDKGNMVEAENIDLMTIVLEKGMATKNELYMEDEFFTGTCDVEFDDCIVDVKSVWNKKTLHQAAMDGLDKDYEWQLRGYMHLWGKPKAVLFYGLCDTPEELNWGTEVIYSDLPVEERWVAYNVVEDLELTQSIIDKVIKCREYLEWYDKELKSKLGRLNYGL